MAETPLRISIAARKAILDFVKDRWEAFDHNSWRDRLLYNDLIYARELSNYLANRYQLNEDRLKSSKMRPIEVPIVQPQIDTMVSQLSNIFLQGNPIFAYVSNPDNKEAMVALNALQQKHETMSRLPKELLLYFKDCCKYNYAAAEVDWVTDKTPNFANSISASPTAEVTYSNTSYNSIKRLDLYNCFFDRICNYPDIPTEGEFYGFNKLINKVTLRSLLNNLAATTGQTSSFKEAFESSVDPCLYYVPEILPDNNLVNSRAFDWYKQLGVDVPSDTIRYKSKYVLTTVYFRAAMEDFKIQSSNPKAIRIFKAHIVNMSVVVYVEELTAAHQLLPIATSRLVDDGLRDQVKSLPESIEAVQTLVTQLHTARIADLARALSDRGIYDPLLLDKKQINDPSPTAKIPIKAFGHGKGMLSTAYMPIPYRNDAAQSLIGEGQMVSRMGEEIVGLNPVQRGGFVKGNKTLGEFQTVMGNADDRTMVYAISLDSQGLATMKEISKTNILQYQGPAKVFSTETKTVMDLNPANLRQIIFEFQVADGLKPISQFENPEVLMGALQFAAQSPQLQARYDMVKLFSWLFTVRGGTDLETFEFTPQQLQQNQMAQQQAQQAQQPQGQQNANPTTGV